VKRKSAKRMIVCFLVMTLLSTVLVGCNNSGGSSAESVSSIGSVSQNASSEGMESSLVNQTGLPIVNEPVTIRMMVQRNVSDLSNSWMEKDCVQRAITDTGLNFEFIEISAAAWAEQIGVTLAGGDLPDVIVGSINNFAAYTESFLALDGLLEEYAPNLTAYFAERPDIRIACELEDGHLYSLPLYNQNGYYSHNNRYAINQEWLDRVKMEIPTTHEELYAVMKAFKEQDANGNGDPNDEIPFTFSGGTANALDYNSYGLNFLFNCFGITSLNYIQVEDGIVSFAPTSDKYREFLEFTSKLYSEGLIDPDGFVQQSNDLLAKGKAGRVGIVAHQSYLDINVGADKIDQYAIMLPTKDSDDNISITPRIIDGGWFYDCYKISKNSKYAEACIRLYDYVLSDEEILDLWAWGPEEKCFTVSEDGTKVRVTKFEEGMTSFAQARQTYGAGMAGFWIYPQELTNRWEKAKRDLLMDRFEEAYLPYLADHIPLGNDKQEAVDRRAELFTEINAYIQNFTAEAIMKGVTDSSWQTHLQNCEKLNVAQYTEDYQNFYNDKQVKE
jgi:putative aldouronate transport system substrate-binding protein